jgi:hypothetical protein
MNGIVIKSQNLNFEKSEKKEGKIQETWTKMERQK